jgi:hypothetical protein
MTLPGLGQDTLPPEHSPDVVVLFFDGPESAPAEGTGTMLGRTTTAEAEADTASLTEGAAVFEGDAMTFEASAAENEAETMAGGLATYGLGPGPPYVAVAWRNDFAVEIVCITPSDPL